MSVKPIFLTEEMKQEMMEEFRDVLDNAKLLDGRFCYSSSYYWDAEQDENGKPIPDKVTVRFSELAARKQEALISEFDTEVGWHGVVHRDPDDPKLFYVSDILVYPQTVTGATVRTDDLNYPKWLYEEVPPAQQNFVSYFGHSHVWMQPSPSDKDNDVALEKLSEQVSTVMGEGLLPDAQEEHLRNFNGNTFYICAIWNKRGLYTMRVFDIANNKFYSEDDCEVEFETEQSLMSFMRNAKAKVRSNSNNRREDTYGSGQKL